MPRKPTKRTVKAALRRLEREVLSLDGVTGVALAEAGGAPQLVVYVERITPALRSRIAGHCDGVPVKLEASGPFEAL